MKEYQVVIVGSGPSGSACAKALKEEGMNVLVLEKDRLPRHKMCSGVIFGQSQVLLQEYFGGLPPEDVRCEPQIIEASNIEEWSKGNGFSNYVWELPKDGKAFPKKYYNIWRNKFDYWLLQEAGVECREEHVFRDYFVSGDKIGIKVSTRDGVSEDLYCSYLVGADGINSRVRMILEPARSKQAKEIALYQAYYRISGMGSLEHAHWNVFFDPAIGDTISSAHRKDEFLTLCVGGFRGRKLKQSMEDFKRFLAENFHVIFGEMERDEGCVLKLSEPCVGEGKVLLVGDAAGLIYLNGEAISAALDSGYRAGKAIAEAIGRNEDALMIYKSKTDDIIRHMKACLGQFHFFVG